MKSFSATGAKLFSRAILPLIAAVVLSTSQSRAGLTLEMNLVRYNYGDNYYYYFSPYLNTNSTPPGVPFGDYFVAAPGFPTNGATALYHFNTNGFNQVSGGSGGFNDFDAPDFNSSFIKSLTNGQWSIFVTNSVTTNVYHFTVTANIDSNSLPDVVVSFPTNGAVNVTNQPTFVWQGPTNYNDLVVYEYNNSLYLPVTQTSWVGPRVLYQGINSFTAHYDSNSTTATVASIPRDSASNSISSWVSMSHLQTYFASQFTVGTVDASGTSHTLVAHYPWDGTNANGTASGVDTSGNGYNMNFSAGFGAQGGANSTTNAGAGPRAIQFHDGDRASAGYVGWNPTPTNLLSALAGSFSVACWIKTTQNFAYDSAPAYQGAGIVAADNGGQFNDVIPLALTGSKIGFNTGGDVEDVTMNSVATVNDGNYHHVVVTRNQLTGQKIIYIDGVLDSFSSGTTNLLNAPQKLTIGALAEASDPNASDPNYYNGYDGLLDDLQIYSGVLSSNEVANLFANPGSAAANGGGASGGHKSVAHYAFDNSGNLGQDSSGNGNDMSGVTWWGPQHQFDTSAEAGGGAVQFFGADAIFPSGQVLTNLDAVLAGSFTFSTWVKTTVTNGADYNNAFYGAVIFWAYNDHGNTNDTIPLAITGSKAAFTTRGGNPGLSDTLHSVTSVNDGHYHLITVTRNQGTGEKKMYVDGNFEDSQIGTTSPLNGNNYNLTIGGWAYVIESNSTVTNYSSYKGLLDDVQIYSGVLSSSDVAYLYNHPGSNVLDTTGQDFNAALNTTNLTWATSGDTSWFVETTNTYNGAPSAAQSGSVTNSQVSTLSTTVTGPGTVMFYWSSIATDPNQGFDYEFYIDDPNTNDIADLLTGVNPWQSIQQITGGPIHIPPGQHTLGWIIFPNGDTDPTQAGYLDQVSFTPTDTTPVSADITLDIYREQDPTYGDTYIALPSINSVSPPATGTTTNRIQSPSDWFNSQADSGGGGSGSAILSSLGQLINECTNGLWTLYINKGLPTERQFHFSASISGLTTNLLSAVKIITPTNGATGVPANAPFKWTGPTNYSSLSVSKQKPDGSGYVSAALPLTATNWPSPPVLATGTNRFDISYGSNGFPNLSFTVPVDTDDSQTVSNWVTHVNLFSTANSIFVVTAGPLTTALLNPLNNGLNFQFQFLSQSGFNHSILYRTNLVAGNWQTNSTVAGDGNLKTITIPLSIFSPSKQGFIRVQTQ